MLLFVCCGFAFSSVVPLLFSQFFNYPCNGDEEHCCDDAEGIGKNVELYLLPTAEGLGDGIGGVGTVGVLCGELLPEAFNCAVLPGDDVL